MADLMKDFLAGGVGGSCLVLVGHPLDTIKVRIQTMPKGKYSGTVDCFKKAIKNEGVKGLYKGMVAPLMSVTPAYAVSFFGLSVGKMLQTPGKPNGEYSSHQIFAAGTLSSCLITPIQAPTERIKCLLQVQENEGTKKYSGTMDCLKKLFKEGGVRSVFKGTLITLVREVPSGGFYFMTYEWLKAEMSDPGRKELSPLKTVFAGGCAGIANWLVALPIDVGKSRFQTAPEGKYSGVLDVYRELLRTEGIGALYKGFVPIIIRAFPANAACFLGYEIAMEFLNKL